MDLWDLYLQHALFAFSVHINSRTGISPFKLQFGVEPRLPSITAMTTGTTAAERSDAKENRRRDRRATVRNLLKYRAIAAEKYRESLERLMDRRDDTAFLKDPIQRGDLVMRSPINRPSKLHPQWDGPSIVLEITNKDTMQLATPNGYILNHLINKAPIRKLNEAETKHFTDEFWQASKRLKKYDER